VLDELMTAISDLLSDQGSIEAAHRLDRAMEAGMDALGRTAA